MISVRIGSETKRFEESVGGVKSLASFFPRIMDIAYHSGTVKECVDGVLEYLNGHHVEAWTEQEEIKKKSSGGLITRADLAAMGSKDIPQIASIAVIHGDNILMGKRNDTQTWTLPGGHIEKNERPEDGARRELMEECSVNPSNIHYLGSKRVVGNSGKEIMVHSYVCFGQHDHSSELDPDAEVQQWRWIDTKSVEFKRVLNKLYNKNDVTLEFLGLQNDK